MIDMINMVNIIKFREIYKSAMAAEPISQELLKFTEQKAIAAGRGPNTKIPRRRRYRYKWRVIIPVAVLLALILATAAAAASVIASKFLKPGEIVAERDGYDALSEAFESEIAYNINESVTSGDYIFTLLSIVSGENLKNEFYYRGGAQDGRTYIILAIENADGAPFPDDFGEIFIKMGLYASPFVKGLEPWHVNIAALSGGGPIFVIDGVMYRLYEVDNIEIFADRGLYFIICGGGAIYDHDAIIYDEDTGEISANPDYEGPCAVFELPIDKSLGDPEKAEEYLRGIGYYRTEPEKPDEIDDIIAEEILIDDNDDISMFITNFSFLDGPQLDDSIIYVQNIGDDMPYNLSGASYSGVIPRNWNEWHNLSKSDQANLISRINWGQAQILGYTGQELFVDETGMITYSYTADRLHGTKHELYAFVSFDELFEGFENNKTAQSKIVSRQITGCGDDLFIYGIKLSVDKAGKITGAVVYLHCPQIDVIPATNKEFMDLGNGRYRFFDSLDWDKGGVTIAGSFRECTLDANGIVNYSWRVYDENGGIAGGGDSGIMFSQFFEDNQTAQTVTRSDGIYGTDDGSLKVSGTRFTMDENGKITAEALEMPYPFAFKQLFVD